MLKITTSVLFVLMLVGCASPATQQAMSVTMQDVATSQNATLKGKLAIRNVTGGKETNPMWTSQVDSQTFKGALDKSLAIAGYKTADTATAKYTIDAHLNELNQPFGGFSMDVVSTVLYTVTGEGKQKQFPVTATGTASMSDAISGIERLRIANEKSIRENISSFLRQLSEQVGW